MLPRRIISIRPLLRPVRLRKSKSSVDELNWGNRSGTTKTEQTTPG